MAAAVKPHANILGRFASISIIRLRVQCAAAISPVAITKTRLGNILNANGLTDDPSYSDEMWLYEWTDGGNEKTAHKYVAHKGIGGRETGYNFLIFGEKDNSYGIAVNAQVFDANNGSYEDCSSSDIKMSAYVSTISE